MLNPVDGDGRFAASLPFFGGEKIWEANPQIVDKLRRRRRAAAFGKAHAQLHALLAAQDADHLPRDDAVVRRDGRRAGMERREARGHAAATGAGRHRGDPVLPVVGQGAAVRDDRQSSGLDAVAAAAVGHADAVFRAQGDQARCIRARWRYSKRWRSGWSRAASKRGRRSTRRSCSAPTLRSTRRSRTRSTSGSTRARRTRR